MEVVGWISSGILLATLVKQVYKQWHEATSEGISKFLFIGQLFASVGFTVYSIYTENWVFIITNALLTINNIIGIFLYYKNLDRGASEKAAA